MVGYCALYIHQSKRQQKRQQDPKNKIFLIFCADRKIVPASLYPHLYRQLPDYYVNSVYQGHLSDPCALFSSQLNLSTPNNW